MELEHETFRNAKVANLYKASVLKKVGTRRGGRGVLRALGGRGSPPHRGAAYSPGSPTSLLSWLEVFLANPVRTRTCLVPRCLWPWAAEPTRGKPGLGAVRS